jgi:A/G-specific adenine glycosylase
VGDKGTWVTLVRHGETDYNRTNRYMGRLNEGLMELGATVCTPRSPKCSACPASGFCLAMKDDLTDEIPPPRQRGPKRPVFLYTVLVQRGGRVLLEQRAGDGLWSRMWQPPTVESPEPISEAELAIRLPMTVTGLSPLMTFVHQTTHREVQFHVFTARTRTRGGTWRIPADTADLPMSNPHRRIVETRRDSD